MGFERITVDPSVMGGVPTLRGLRIPVATVVSMVADGMTAAEVVADLPDLELPDVAEALRYAPSRIADLLRQNLPQVAEDAVVVLANDEIRVRHLPISPA